MISLQKSYFKNCPWMADSHDQPSTSILFEKKCFLQGELSPMEYSPGLYCTVVSFLLSIVILLCGTRIIVWMSKHSIFSRMMSKHSILSENFGYTHVWLFMWFVCIACVPLYSTVQPQSGTILFFPHFYIWSKWIDKSSRTWQFDLLRFYSALGINTWLIFL